LLPTTVDPKRAGPPLDPSMLILPAMVTLPVASIVTGVLAALRVKVTVTPAGMLIVVKLNAPSGGSVSVVLLVGLNAPSAPVLPLLKVCPKAEPALAAIAASRTNVNRQCLMIDLLSKNRLTQTIAPHGPAITTAIGGGAREPEDVATRTLTSGATIKVEVGDPWCTLTAGATRLLTEKKVGKETLALTAWAATSSGCGSRSATVAEAVMVGSSCKVAVTVTVGGE
jgi:hypothetical protein